MCPTVRTVRPARRLPAGDVYHPRAAPSPCATCGGGHPSGASTSFLITTIWLIDNHDSVNVVNIKECKVTRRAKNLESLLLRPKYAQFLLLKNL